MYLCVTIYQQGPCGQCWRTMLPTRHAPAGASTVLPTPRDFQHMSARCPHHQAQQLHCIKSHRFFFKQTCCIINHLTMPHLHKVKINTKIHSTVSHSSGSSLLHQTLGTLAKPREQELVMPEVQFRTPHQTANSRTAPLRTELTGAVRAQGNITCSWFRSQWFFVKVFKPQCTGSELIFP